MLNSPRLVVMTMIGTALVVSGVAALLAWLLWPTPDPIPGSMDPLPITKAEKKAGDKRPIQPKKPVLAVPETVKPHLGLPETVQSDPDMYVLATGKLQAEERPYTLSTVLDMDTGDTQVYARPDPLPWLGLERKTAIGLAYGINDDGRQVSMLHGRVDVLRVKQVHAGAVGMVDTTGRAFVGLSAEVRF